MNDFSQAKKGQMEFKQTPELRKTLDNMKLNQWYSFDKEHYSAWYMLSNGKTKTKYPYRIEVKMYRSDVYVRKVPVLEVSK